MLDMQLAVARSAEAGAGVDIHLHQRLGDAAPGSAAFHQAHEEIRVLGDAKTRVEATHGAQPFGAERNPAASGQAIDETARARPAAPVLNLLAPVLMLKDHAGPAKIDGGRHGVGTGRRGEEPRQHLVVVVEKRHDGGTGQCQGAVARGGGTQGLGVANDVKRHLGESGKHR